MISDESIAKAPFVSCCARQGILTNSIAEAAGFEKACPFYRAINVILSMVCMKDADFSHLLCPPNKEHNKTPLPKNGQVLGDDYSSLYGGNAARTLILKKDRISKRVSEKAFSAS